MADLENVLDRAGSALRTGGFWCMYLVIVLSPWWFGSWEMWWFWPMAVLLFLGAFLAGTGSLLGSAFTARLSCRNGNQPAYRMERRLAVLLLSVLPFLLYAVWRSTRPSAPDIPLVEMEAERSLLLMGTPVLLCLTLFLSANRRRINLLGWTLLANGALLACYAVANYFITRNIWVLWVKTPFYYAGRSCGPYFCPNHFVDHMNMGLALVLAFVFTRRATGLARGLVLLPGIPFAMAWFQTLSRGGVASFILALPFFLLIALRGQGWKKRLLASGGSILILSLAFWALFAVPNPLQERINSHYLTKIIRSELKKPEPDRDLIRKTFLYKFDRGTYIDAALRAWRSNPRIGVGPGQHAIRWPEFAPTPDGDRETGRKPTLANHTFYLYEVHSDWTQLLEEYGTVGFGLFLLPLAVVMILLYRAQGDGLRNPDSTAMEQTLPCAAMFAAVVFAIHSVGDFSLQVPAITWNFAALVCCGLLATLPECD